MFSPFEGLTSQQIVAFIVLLMTLGFSLFSSVLTNIATYARQRPHNFIRLFNEALTRLFFGYFTFFIALVLTLYNSRAGVERIGLDLGLAMSSLFCWGMSVYVTSLFSDMTYVKRIHGCNIVDNRCTNQNLADFRDFIKICWLNIVGAIFFFLLVSFVLLGTKFLIIDTGE